MTISFCCLSQLVWVTVLANEDGDRVANPLAEKPQRQTQEAAAHTEEQKLQNVRSPKELNSGGEAEGLRLAGHPGSTVVWLWERRQPCRCTRELRPQAKLRSQKVRGGRGPAGEGRGSPPAVLQLTPPRTCCRV